MGGGAARGPWWVARQLMLHIPQAKRLYQTACQGPDATKQEQWVELTVPTTAESGVGRSAQRRVCLAAVVVGRSPRGWQMKGRVNSTVGQYVERCVSQVVGMCQCPGGTAGW
jgi:hypothetical protein